MRKGISCGSAWLAVEALGGTTNKKKEEEGSYKHLQATVGPFKRSYKHLWATVGPFNGAYKHLCATVGGGRALVGVVPTFGFGNATNP